MRHRRGISLLEVLISMFILLFGLMGVAALLPVGNYHAAKALQYDRASAVAQASFHEIKARGFLNPSVAQNSTGTTVATHWRHPDGSDISLASLTAANGFAFDPLMCSERTEASLSTPGTFPPNSTGGPQLTRLTLAHAIGVGGGGQKMVAAHKVFESHDDITTLTPGDVANNTDFVQQQYSRSGAHRVARDYQGHFTWMFTAIPRTTFGDDVYTVTVVVFNKRLRLNSEIQESMVNVNLQGGHGGGRARLTATSGTVLEEWVHPGEYMMLSRTTGGQSFFDWYRIQSKGAVNGTTVDVTLIGPDWPPGNWSGTVCNGAIAVFSDTMRIETPSLWSTPVAP